MAVNDRIRLNIRQCLEPLIGIEEADALVNRALSPSLDDLATTGTVTSELALLRADIRGEMAVLREEMRTMEERLRREFRDAIIGQTRWIIGFIMGWTGVVLALATWLFR